MAARTATNWSAHGSATWSDVAEPPVSDADPTPLRQRWRRVLGRAAPPNLSPRLMARILAWREQVLICGDVDRETRAALAAALGDSDATRPVGRRTKSSELKVGTILGREHNGILHRVMVLEAGFAWNGQTYRSLSEVARAITGTNWNGYRFFAVKKSGHKPEPKPASDGGVA